MDTPYEPHSWRKTAQLAVVLALLPLFVAWGLGVVHPWLDEASRYSASLASLPAASGSAGVLILAVLCGLSIAFRRRVDMPYRSICSLSELLGLLGALSLLCSVLAMTRPGGWVACIALLACVRGDTESNVATLRLPFVMRHCAGVVCWFLAGRIQPFASGLLGDDIQASLEMLVQTIPSGMSQAGLALLVAGLLVLSGWSARLSSAWLVGGAAAALIFEHAFAESLDGFLSLALIGSFAAALPQRLAPRQGLFVPVLFVLLVVSLLAVRLGFAERWDCRSLDTEGGARLLAEGDYQGVALVPDNMPFLVVLAEGGRSLTRLSPGGGGVSESRLLDHPGGLLVSPPAGTKMIGRLVQSVDELRVEWWDVFTLERSAVKTLPLHCDPGLSFMEPGGARQWIACKASGEVLVVDPRPEGPLTRWDMGSGVLGVQRLIGGVLIDREGADSRAGIYEDQGLGLAELQLGPHATGMVSVSEFGEAFSVGRGPAGHVELRGRAPAVEYQYPLDLDTKEGALEALGTRFDSVRVGRWPGRPIWIEGENSVYVSSPVDARIWRVDLEVSWHQASVAVGAVPRQVVVDSPSQTLFGVNRCGVFEARIKSTFPWRDVPGPPTPVAVEKAS